MKNRYIKLTSLLLSVLMLLAVLASCEVNVNVQETCEHEYADWKETTPADCENEGVEERSCGLCGEKETQASAKFSHMYISGKCVLCGGAQPITDDPTETPTQAPTESTPDEPTSAPTEKPTQTESPTQKPTEKPTQNTTQKPTEKPSEVVTENNTQAPTQAQTQKPTEKPTQAPTEEQTEAPTEAFEKPAVTRPEFTIPEYNGEISIEINGNVPSFKENQLTTDSYEYYAPLDSLGRCGVTVACIGKDLMPTTDRGSISSVSPTGWHGGGIYERSHLIGWQLTGENANKSNLISGTRNLNGEMVTYENMVADYIKETGNHVMYRVTPIFEGDNLLASGIQMEAYSVEDNGEGISFNIYIFNVQLYYIIDYATGDFELDPESPPATATYVINKGNGKFHVPTCSGVADMKEENKIYSTKTREELEAEGYTVAGCCKNKA